MAPLTWKDYHKHNGKWWEGKKAKTLNLIRNNGGDEIPMGSIVEITQKFQGFQIRSDIKKPNGCFVAIRRIPPYDLELV